MALDRYNLKLQKVSLASEEKFKKSVPEAGEPHWRINKYYVSIGDGVTPGGYALASKDWVINAIHITEVQGNTKGIETS